MANVLLDQVKKHYGNFAAVDTLDLQIVDGEFLVLLGPSGCGKTTTLRMIAGLIPVSSGRILLGERDVTHVPVYRRNIGIVFQNYALFPHLNVFENVAFGLRRRKYPEDRIRTKVDEVLHLVQLESLSARYARQLSGGQQQRVAIARALAIEPDVLLLDEPLSSLDAKLRLGVRRQIRELQHKLGITTILVTHDQEEAMSMGDRLAVLKDGKMQQVGTPREVYRTPANAFVADFIGTANFFTGTVSDDGASLHTESGLHLGCTGLPSGRQNILVRPEAVRLLPVGRAEGSALAATMGRVVDVSYLGPTADILVRLDTADMVTVRADSMWMDGTGVCRDAEVMVDIPPGAVTVLR
jgi:spermidine/putrescine ABC transporter ATP-binding subunit